MRSAAWFAPLALLMLAGAAGAQLAPPSFQLSVSPSSATVAPGNSTLLEVTATRTCPSAAAVLEEQVAEVAIHHGPGIAVASVGQVAFRQQVCASQPQQVVSWLATLGVPSDYDGPELAALRIELHPLSAPGPTVGGYGDEASVTSVIRVEGAAPLSQASSAEEPPLEAPALPAILLAVALLGGAFALRRR